MSTNYGGTTVTDRRWKPADVTNPVAPGEFAVTQDIKTLDTNLVLISASYWTPARLAQESWWDKLYYIRCTYASGGLA
jgi:hypothetical protein